MIFQKISNTPIKSNLIKRALNSSISNGHSTEKTVLLFGGQGNQQKGMLNKFLENPKAKSLISTEGQKLEIDLLQISTTDKDNLINKTQYTQPLLLMSQFLQCFYGEKRINLSKHYRQSTFCIGHSLGEYTSLVVSGSIRLTDCLKLVYWRGILMNDYTKLGRYQLGTLIIKFREDKLPKILEQVQILKLQVSCYNSPTNIVVSGEIEKLVKLKDYMKSELKIASKLLPAATAFHSHHLERMRQQFKKKLEKIDFKPPIFQIIRNFDCQIYKNKDDIIQGLLQQLSNPVLFTNSVQKLIKQQGKQNLNFIEFGHKQYLNRWVDEVREKY